jgi:hypothetical protein
MCSLPDEETVLDQAVLLNEEPQIPITFRVRSLSNDIVYHLAGD